MLTQFVGAPLYEADDTGGSAKPDITPDIQAEINRLAGNARKEGKTVATQELLKALGVESLDDAKALVEAQRTAKAAQQSEADRAKAEAEAYKQRATQTERLAKEALADARLEVTAQAIKVGDVTYRAKDAALVAKLVDRSTITVDLEKRSVEGVQDAIKTIVEQYPWMFDSDSTSTETAQRPNFATRTPRSTGDTRTRDDMEAALEARMRASGKYA